MTAQLTRLLPNWITFPRQLRNAIPDWEPCGGRVLELESADAGATNTPWAGRRVTVKLRCCETGKLNGIFDISIDLNISAAQALADVLRTAAEQAKQ